MKTKKQAVEMGVLVVDVVEWSGSGLLEQFQASHRNDVGDCVVHPNGDYQEKGKFERVMMAFIWDTLRLRSLQEFLEMLIMYS